MSKLLCVGYWSTFPSRGEAAVWAAAGLGVAAAVIAAISLI